MLISILLVTIFSFSVSAACTTDADCSGVTPLCVDVAGELTCTSCTVADCTAKPAQCPNTLDICKPADNTVVCTTETAKDVCANGICPVAGKCEPKPASCADDSACNTISDCSTDASACAANSLMTQCSAGACVAPSS